MDHPSPSESERKRSMGGVGTTRPSDETRQNEFQMRQILTNAATVQVELVQNHMPGLLTHQELTIEVQLNTRTVPQEDSPC